MFKYEIHINLIFSQSAWVIRYRTKTKVKETKLVKSILTNFALSLFPTLPDYALP